MAQNQDSRNTSPFRPELFASLTAANASSMGYKHGYMQYTEDGNCYIANSTGTLQSVDGAFSRTTAQLTALTPTSCHIAMVSDASPVAPAFFDVTSGNWINMVTLEAL